MPQLDLWTEKAIDTVGEQVLTRRLVVLVCWLGRVGGFKGTKAVVDAFGWMGVLNVLKAVVVLEVEVVGTGQMTRVIYWSMP